MSETPMKEPRDKNDWPFAIVMIGFFITSIAIVWILSSSAGC